MGIDGKCNMFSGRDKIDYNLFPMSSSSLKNWQNVHVENIQINWETSLH